MRMNDTVARIVEIVFQDINMNDETNAIREEVTNNCQERYADLLAAGMHEDEAISAIIDSLKGMDEVLEPYKKEMKGDSPVVNELCGVQEMIFVADMVREIDLQLISESVQIHPSEDPCYHVFWNADESQALKAENVRGILKIYRNPELDRGIHGKKQVHADGDINIQGNSINEIMTSVSNVLQRLFGQNGSFNWSMGSASNTIVTIQIPANAAPEVKLLSTSGDIEVKNASLSELNITTTSGDISINRDEDHDLRRAKICTTSGDVESVVFAKEMTIVSTSGDADVEGRIETLCFSSVSGDLDVRADVTEISFKSISGDVDLTFDSDEIKNVNGSTVSGDVQIKLPEGIGVMAIHTNTRSGDVTTRYHTNDIGPVVNGSVSSMSGDITIR